MGRPQGTPLREDEIYKIRRTIYYLSFIMTISYKVKALPILTSPSSGSSESRFRYSRLVAAG